MAKHVRIGEGGARSVVLTIALTWLAVMLVLPFVSVFVAAFADGLPAFLEALGAPEARHAMMLTSLAVVVSVVFNVTFGIAAAFAVERTRLPGRQVIPALLDLPIAVSPVVAGLMFLLLFGRQGWFGDVLDAVGVNVVFALPGVLIATIFVTLPFVAKEVIAVLRETGVAEEEAAATLGAGPLQTFLHVMLPNIRWAVFYGVVLTAARALGEFGAVSVLSGNLISQTQTLPLYVEQAYTDYQTVAAFSAAVPLTLLGVATIAAQKLVAWFGGRERNRPAPKEAS